MNKSCDIEQLELRSEKVRNIIKEKPPIVIRYGTTIIAAILLAVGIVFICMVK